MEGEMLKESLNLNEWDIDYKKFRKHSSSDCLARVVACFDPYKGNIDKLRAVIDQIQKDAPDSELEYLLEQKKELKERSTKPTRMISFLESLQPVFAQKKVLMMASHIKDDVSPQKQKEYVYNIIDAVEAGIPRKYKQDYVRRIVAYKSLVEHCNEHDATTAEVLLEHATSVAYLDLAKKESAGSLWSFISQDWELEEAYNKLLNLQPGWMKGKVVNDRAEAAKRRDIAGLLAQRIREMQSQFVGEHEKLQPVASALKHIALGFGKIYYYNDFDPALERGLMGALRDFHETYIKKH
ncbi:hypothetical protein KY330_00530 [Candidatus Woesearchaeota archaeon]|nr:hypothetical protein [Candidatus Woesearchaeota archaeon]